MVLALPNTTKSTESNKVGKALSAWHKKKMIEHASIVPVMKQEQRLKAVGTENDFPEDAVTTYITRHAEEIFEPKRILTNNDWLKSYREPDQYFSNYKAGKGNIKWVNA